MKIFEPHIHMYSRTTDDYKKMALCGVRCIVEPAFWLGSDKKYPESFLDYFNHMMEFETKRAASFGMDYYACLAVNPKEANNITLAKEVVGRMVEYLDHPKCIAIGEIGLDKNTEAEVEVLRLQLRLAKKRNMLTVVHTPHVNKKVGAKRIIEVLTEEGMNPDRVLIDHNTEETIEMTIEYGAWAGMTLYPTKLSPERVVSILKTYGIQRMMINSSADWGDSDPINVAQASLELRKAGFKEQDIERLIWDNPTEFYRQSGKLKL
ncbi:TatD related DNase [Sporomusa ovata DSM 2662]|uniref:Hydrolase TatD n=1 Tax=Sporomusa ovata TaxID=2378 RepID=A0A0U1L4H5_9FIRM|nr:TatD family hydrolase [Sporomusa ovata]EQB25221.1 metal dependent hydrolase [Sporomusa ovata DSM 2662]CQR73784.1 hypothetical protein SpAn4DRAFT_0246 [Sporomusa ovata]